jgi:hypothetical protein
MTWLDHFLADAVPTAVMTVIVVSAAITALVSAYLLGVRHGRRDALQAIDDMCAGFEEQIAQTVPMLTDQAGGR